MFKIIFKNFKRKDYLMAVVSILLIVLGVYLDLLMPDYMSEMTMFLSWLQALARI